MTPFLKHIAQELLKLSPPVLQQTIVVFPNKRAIVFLKHYMAQELVQPTWLPKLISIEDFIVEQSGLQLADNISLQFKLYEVYLNYMKKEESDTLEQFLKWSQILLYDFNEIDRYMVDAKALLTNLSGLKELEQWSLNNNDLTPFQEKYIRFFEHIYVWYNDFRKKLLEDGLGYQGMAYRQAAERIHLQPFIKEEVWFVGLNALTTAEKNIIQHLKDVGKAKLFWDADSHYVDNKIHEAGMFMRQHQQKWGGLSTQKLLANQKKIRLIGCAKNVGQSRVAGQIISTFDKKSIANGEIALILADEQLLFPVLNNLADIENLNITMGAPLSSTPLFTLVDLLLRMQVRYNQYQRGGFYYRDVQKLLRHPYSAYLFEQTQLQMLIKDIKQKNIVFVKAKHLSIKDDLIKQFLSPWDNASVTKQLQALIDRLKETLITDKASLASEVLFQFQKSLKQLVNYLEDNQQELTIKTLKSIFYQLIGKESVPFRGEPLKGLQIMGLLETRTLDFKKLIILSVNEEKIPAGKSNNSFIPFVLKKFFKMPTHQERDAVFAYHFYRLLQRVEEAYLVYNTQNDDFGSGEPSRFLIQLKAELTNVDIKNQILHTNFPEITNNRSCIIKTPSVIRSIKKWMQNGVSPSALNNYINCPLGFYYRYIANIRLEEEVLESIDSATLGSSLHESLEHAYRPFVNKFLKLSDIENIKNNSINHLKKSLQNQFKDSLNHGKNYLLYMVSQQMCTRFLELERKILNQNHSIQILYLEHNLSYNLLYEDISVNLTGTVDRIDFFDKQLRIIDYKSGMISAKELIIKSWDDLITKNSNAKSFQLMMYSYLYLKNYINQISVIAGNYSFKNIKEELLCVKNKNENKPMQIGKEEINYFEKQLIKLLNEILDKNKPFEQVDGSCSCDYCKALGIF